MIIKAIERAYTVMHERNWDTVYWAIDLHGVCFASTYEQGGYAFINDSALAALRAISARPESKIILWSSCHAAEQSDIMAFFAENSINVSYFNENPEVVSTKTGDFTKKFYFSVLLDDKAGFDPDYDWAAITNFLSKL